ncbi:MAG: hypothetical protein Q9M43_05810 [Sulfurimonas sp.]|nr:hypothetical protein [Sulfurimonas sp.]
MNTKNEEETLSLEDMVYINKEHKMAIIIDENQLLCYDYDSSIELALPSTEGILNKISIDVGNEIEDFFKIQLKDYDVEAIHQVTTLKLA